MAKIFSIYNEGKFRIVKARKITELIHEFRRLEFGGDGRR
jgi:hypothetical protein